MSYRLSLSIVIAALLLTACGPDSTESAPASTVAPTSTHIPVDLTPAQRAALAALAQQLGISADTIALISAEAVVWPNGCLGVIHLGVMCTQNLVRGFRIVLAASGQKYEFHTNQDGTAVAYADPNAPFTPTNTHVPVDLTSAQRAALAALAKQLGISADMIQLVSTEAMEWPNGCMGVVHIGVMCTQNVVQGFRIILSVTDQTYEFHTNQDGSAAVYAAPGAPFLRLAVQAADHSLQIVDTQIGAGINNMAAETGLLPLGGASGASVYGLSVTDKPAAVAVDSSGSRPLDFINTNYGLAVFPGGAGSGPMLAWGASLSADTRQTQLFTGLPDGSQVQALLTEAISTPQAYQLVAERWAADGKSLYFSREPYGLGGYILFSGASSLYKINLADKQVTEVIPIDFKAAHFICLDALSLDARLVADHCTANVITIRDLSAQTATAIQPPAEITAAAMLGSARFSPDGQRVAFALARGNPEGEQGWAAVSDSLSGGSHLIAASAAGQFFTVAAWLNNDTLLLQSNTLQCNPTCASELWSVTADGSNLHKVADGTFVTIIGGTQN